MTHAGHIFPALMFIVRVDEPLVLEFRHISRTGFFAKCRQPDRVVFSKARQEDLFHQTAVGSVSAKMPQSGHRRTSSGLSTDPRPVEMIISSARRPDIRIGSRKKRCRNKNFQVCQVAPGARKRFMKLISYSRSCPSMAVTHLLIWASQPTRNRASRCKSLTGLISVKRSKR